MKLAALIIGGMGVGNLISLPLYLFGKMQFSFPMSTGASIVGTLCLITAFGTWKRKTYGWRCGFWTILAAAIWFMAAVWSLFPIEESRMTKLSIMVVCGLGVLMVSAIGAGIWRLRRSWFKEEYFQERTELTEP